MSAYNNPSNSINAAPAPGSVPPGQNPVLKYYEEWSEKTPLITKSTVIAMMVCYVISFFFDADSWFGNNLHFTYANFEFYRILTSSFVGNSLLMLIFGVIIFVVSASKFENSQGSLRFVYLMTLLVLLINFAHNLICLIVWLVGLNEALKWNCMGFWNIVYCLMTIECALTPDQPRQLLCIPYPIPSLYFPFLIYLLFSLFDGFNLSYLIAITLGFAYEKGYLNKLLPTSQFFENLESGGMCFKISRTRGWVLAASSIGHDAFIAVNQNQIDRSSSSSSSTTTGGTGTGSGSGGRGGKVGGGGGKRGQIHGFGDLSDDTEAGGGGNTGFTPTATAVPSFSGRGHKLTDSSVSGASAAEGSGTTATATATSNPILSVFNNYIPSGYSSLPTADDSHSASDTAATTAAAGTGTSGTAGALSREQLAAKRMAALNASKLMQQQQQS